MFVGEAPGRLGAERTAIPFHGDVAGENFEKLLHLAGLSRSQVFVTNSILCNPTDERGNNKPPSRTSIRNCTEHLRAQIEVVNPKLVVTLGAAALAATSLIEDHSLKLSEAVRTEHSWFGRSLVPLYHPGARAMIHRNFATQTADYYFVGERSRRLEKSKRRYSNRRPSRDGWDVVRFLMAEVGQIDLFSLHKMVYILDYRYTKKFGDRLTDFYFIRQKDGPYCVELGTRWYKDFDDKLRVKNSSKTLSFCWEDGGLFSTKPSLPEHMADFIGNVVRELAQKDRARLKTIAYLSNPMKAALKAERMGASGLNRALL